MVLATLPSLSIVLAFTAINPTSAPVATVTPAAATLAAPPTAAKPFPNPEINVLLALALFLNCELSKVNFELMLAI